MVQPGQRTKFYFLYLAAFHSVHFSYSNYIFNISPKSTYIMKYYVDNNTYISLHMRILLVYRGADNSLARPGRKQANVCQNGVNFLRRLTLQEKT
jgi:hypothetical protein